MLRPTLFLLFAAVLGFSAHAADKSWHRLDACRYVPDKSNDGDSFLVQCANAKKFFVRLYYVDAPESEASFPERVRQQYDYFGVTMDELTRGGAHAGDYVGRLLGNRYFTIHTRYSFAQGRSRNTRYYGLVVVENRYLHELLLSEGLARNKGSRVALPTGEKARTYAAALQRLEDDARVRRRGVWATSVESKRAAHP